MCGSKQPHTLFMPAAGPENDNGADLSLQIQGKKHVGAADKLSTA